LPLAGWSFWEGQRCRAMVRVSIKVDGKVIEPRQFRSGRRWTVAAYDLRAYRGRTIEVAGLVRPIKDHEVPKSGKAFVEAWLTVDRAVKVEQAKVRPNMPYAIGQAYRRINHNIVPKSSFRLDIAQ